MIFNFKGRVKTWNEDNSRAYIKQVNVDTYTKRHICKLLENTTRWQRKEKKTVVIALICPRYVNAVVCK